MSTHITDAEIKAKCKELFGKVPKPEQIPLIREELSTLHDLKSLAEMWQALRPLLALTLEA